jgi:hypothetical protein
MLITRLTCYIFHLASLLAVSEHTQTLTFASYHLTTPEVSRSFRGCYNRWTLIRDIFRVRLEQNTSCQRYKRAIDRDTLQDVMSPNDACNHWRDVLPGFLSTCIHRKYSLAFCFSHTEFHYSCRCAWCSNWEVAVSKQRF